MKAKKTLYVVSIAFVIFVLLVPLVSYSTLRSSLKNEVFNHLITTRDILYHQIHDYFHERLGDIDVLARNPIVAQSFSQMVFTSKISGLEGSEHVAIVKLYQPLMEHYIDVYGYANVFFTDKEGNVFYSVKAEEFTGTNLLNGKYKDFSISHVFRRGLEQANFEDYSWSEKAEEFTSFFAAPIYYKDELLGAMIIEIPFSIMDSMLTQRAGLGKTGEMYLVGDDGLMRSNLRFIEEPAILKKYIDTEATRLAFNNYTGIKIIKDYRGVSVLSAYRSLNLKFVDWVLLVEIDEEEALAPIRTVETRLIIIGTIIMGIAVGYIYFSMRKTKNKEFAK